MPTPFKIQGLPQLQNKLKNLTAKMEDDIEEALFESATTIVNNAKSAAPVDLGFLRLGISSFKSPDTKLSYEIVSAAGYSAYVEFGTRSSVLIPLGLEQYAAQFKGKSQQGIGQHPQPYFFPAFEGEKPKLIARIKKIVTDIK